MSWFQFDVVPLAKTEVSVPSGEEQSSALVPIVKDLSEMMPLFLPLFAMVIFTLTIKNEVEKQWIRIEGKFEALSKEIVVIGQANKDVQDELNQVKKRVIQLLQERQDILNQLHTMGIRIYCSENDRRWYANKDDPALNEYPNELTD